MNQLFDTLFVTEPDISLHLEGEAIRAVHEDGKTLHIPLNRMEKIIVFSNRTVTRPLMACCAGHKIDLCFLSENGRFLFRISGPLHGNTELRKRQYTLSEEERLLLAKKLIEGRIKGEISLIRDFRYNHPAISALRSAEQALKDILHCVKDAKSGNQLRGIEGNAAHIYYRAFSHMILSDHPEYQFQGRSRRPPEDPCNAMLSFAYTLLTEDCAAALDAAGLDPYVGVLHGVRPGKPSLALDMMELFRATVADRHVLRLVNRSMISPDSFQQSEAGGVYLSGDGQNAFLREWNRWKKQTTYAQSIEDTIPNGLLVHLEAQSLARWLRREAAYREIEVKAA